MFHFRVWGSWLSIWVLVLRLQAIDCVDQVTPAQKQDCDKGCTDYYRNCNPIDGLKPDKNNETIDCQHHRYQLRCPMTCKVCKKCEDGLSEELQGQLDVQVQKTNGLEQQIADIKTELANQNSDMEKMEQLLTNPDYCIAGWRDCANGGTCGSDNRCTCTEAFIGPFCKQPKPIYHWDEWSEEKVVVDNENELKKIKTRKCLQDNNQQADASRCPAGEESKTTEWLIFRKDPNTWPQAKKDCENIGGWLWASLDGTSEQIDSILQRLGLSDDKSIWAGFNDEAKEGEWVNLQGEAASDKVRWNEGEPNGLTNENTMEVYKRGVNDMPGTPYTRSYVCSMPLGNTYHGGEWAAEETIIDNDHELKKVKKRTCLRDIDNQPADASKCPPNYLSETTEWLQFRKDPQTWSDAKQDCEKLGGLLWGSVEMTNEQIDAFLKRMGISGKSLWTGFNDQDNEGTWVNLKGEKTVNANWNAGEPNGGKKENFMERTNTIANDTTEVSKRSYVCDMLL